MATLVHDDLVDGARMRRGAPAAWSVFGSGAALSAGDYLFACAFAELAATEDSAAVAILADACLALARGEAMQRIQTRKPETTIDDYLERCALKTGKLFEAACRLGSGGDRDLGAYGLALGIAFQIADDILDCAGQTQETGKIPGTDLREGTPTMPLLLAAQQDEVVRHALAGGPLEGALVRVAGDRRARPLARGRARLRGQGAVVHRERPASRGARVTHLRRGGQSLVTAIADDRMLDIVREKVEAGERLDLEDGLALLESDDLLALGELADLARRVRGGDDCVYFVQNIYLNQTNVCRVKCKFCAFAATQKQEQAYTITPDDLVADARAEHERLGFTEIHMVNGENPHVGFDFYVETIGKLHDALPDVFLKCYTASEIHHMTTLSGLTHEQVLRELQGCRARCAHGRRRRGLRRSRPSPRRARQGAPGHLVPRPRHRSPARDPDALHAPLRTRRDLRGADRAPAPAPRPAGQDGRLPRVHPARVPSREHGLRAARLHLPDRRRRPEDARRVSPDARQHREHQGLLDLADDADRAGRPPLRRQRRAGHDRPRGDLPRRRLDDRHRAEDRGARPHRPRRRPDPGSARHALQRGPPVGSRA